MKIFRFIIVVLAVLFVIAPLLHFVQAKSTGGPEPSLILYLPFDEGEGNIAGDASKYGNHGNLQGMKPNLPEWVDGKFGKAKNLLIEEFLIGNKF